MREANVWKWLEDNKPPGLAIERVETLYPPGMSDCFFTLLDSTTTAPAVSGWLELKYCEPTDKSYRAGYIPKLRPTQPMFLTRQFKNRVPCGIFLRVGNEASYVFKPTGDPLWNQEIRSIRGVGMAVKRWEGMPSSVWEVVANLFPL